MQWFRKRAHVAVAVAGVLSLLACGDDGSGEDLGPDGGLPPGPTEDGAVSDGATLPTDASTNKGADAEAGLDMDAMVDAMVGLPDAAPAEMDGAAAEDAASPDAAAISCTNGCDDGVICTIDLCAEGRCVHKLNNSACQAGSSCDLSAGCEPGNSCTTTADCADTEACTSNERCDPVALRCVWDTTDLDGDGDAPVSCGGTDCDDLSGLIGPTASDGCDGIDNDCDGMVDEQASCDEGSVCEEGACTCAAGFDECGLLLGCVDLQTDAENCGECGESCGLGGVCTAGACSCPVAGTVTTCGETCTDTSRDLFNCGACGQVCNPFGAGGQLNSCLGGECVACGQEGQPCCALTGCAGALSCEGTQGSPDATCQCGEDAEKCGDTCVDTRTDEANCGACGVTCEGGEVCLAAATGSACVACGGLGEPCCDSFNSCPGTNVCGPDDTCVRPTVAVPGDGDAGMLDGGMLDSGMLDGGMLDASTPDAAAPDAGEPEAATPAAM